MDENRIDRWLEGVLARDPALAQELQQRLAKLPELPEMPAPTAKRMDEQLDKRVDEQVLFRPKTIVLKTGRPVLAVRDDAAVLAIEEAESQVWRERLAQAQPCLTNPIRAVGRVELEGHPDYAWVGTGWLVAEDVIVTNRHVAQVFAQRAGDAFRFRQRPGGEPLGVQLDFLRELDSERRRVRRVTSVLHIEPDSGPDVAFLQLSREGVGDPITLDETAPRTGQQVAVIGYPARDSRIPDADLMARLFGNVYDRKRLSPGQIIGVSDGDLLHDCTTLGGNSGSAILSLTDGRAVGLHFAGRFLQANFAVPAAQVAERLKACLSGARPSSPGTDASGSTGGGASGQDLNSDDDTISETEAPIASYLGREGYRADFLGHGVTVALPQIVRDADQLLHFDLDGQPRQTELRYHHFSVLMHRARRLCFFSAVNIDGQQSRRTRRPAWQYDPRIPREYQVMKACYGNPPRFSRGHMTRREDPAWGDQGGAQLGNADSMHVTNAVPQMQTFNGGIWLGLEDYALENARQDDMKICVFTGPIFREDDPVRFGVQVPVQFWKVIAFLHDETGALSATGYAMSQQSFLGEQEFVFGRYDTWQRPLAWIEAQAGVSFGELTAHDRFEDTEGAATGQPLTSPRQIRWT